MKQGKYILAEQYGERGYYAKVELKIEENNTIDGVKVEFDSKCAQDWRSAVIFGIEYAWEHLPNSEIGGVKVEVKEIHGFIIDTSQIVAAYAAMHAFWEAMDVYPDELPTFNKATGIFSFPK